jgi:hypothetical protein
LNKKRSKKTKILKKKTMPQVFMIGVFAILIAFILIAKGLVHNSYKEVSVLALSENYQITAQKGLSETEQGILALLKDVLKPADREGRKEMQSSVYYNTLEDFFCSEKVEISTDQAAAVNEKIMKINAILTEEGKTDYTRLSMDARNAVLYLLEQVYEGCGLKLSDNMEGTITKITDLSGNILYSQASREQQSGFQWDVMAVIIAFNVLLFIICRLIARKNQLFNKEESYDGFDEEKFA